MPVGNGRRCDSRHYPLQRRPAVREAAGSSGRRATSRSRDRPVVRGQGQLGGAARHQVLDLVQGAQLAGG